MSVVEGLPTWVAGDQYVFFTDTLVGIVVGIQLKTI